MFQRVLVANRGEIACRILRTLDRLGVEGVAVYSEADADAPHVAMAAEAVLLGPAPVAQSYLKVEAILEAAKATGAQAVHPGYGLLSENEDFARACEEAGLFFLGPTPEQIRAFGLKHEARRLAEESGVPLVPGTGLLDSAEDAVKAAARIGYPVMLKSTAGGGGIGMRVCRSDEEVVSAYASVERLGQANFGQSGIFLEKFIKHARHLEVQVFGDGAGAVKALGVRDCSAQRRNQKVVEESPPPNVPASVVDELQACAVELCTAVRYRSAGTVEFVYDVDEKKFYFLEVNTRLQVEHGVTELVTGLDLVEWMVRLGAGEGPDLKEPVPLQGHAIQVRLYAEDPNKDFQPSSGLLNEVAFPEGIRIDTWIETGAEISAYYDPLLAKPIVHAPTRQEALAKLGEVLQETRLYGIETNLDYLRQVVAGAVFAEGRMTTRGLAEFTYRPRTIDVLRAGTQTTVQDWPGRLGHWHVGVPPSGPMDARSFRLANRLVGNPSHAAGLEITASGPCLRFNAEATFVLTGAEMPATLNERPVHFFEPVVAPAGSVLDIGTAAGPGVRAYLALRGGFDVPDYLGSKATFTLGQFGGHGGRALRPGDVLHTEAVDPLTEPCRLPDEARPAIGRQWQIGVLYGPHGAPDFFTPEDIETFFTTEYEVHYNSARTGVRLLGPKPQWARPDGGEAGLHPSNLHDNAYAVGAVDFTGDMPILLGPDGPSLGGFVCPAVIALPELWKMGQLRPGDTVRFVCLTPEEADRLRHEEEAFLATCAVAQALRPLPAGRIPNASDCILHDEGEGDERLLVRRSGDDYVLVEIGPMELKFALRFRVHLLYEALLAEELPGIIDLTPGIRSLQVHFDPGVTSTSAVLEAVVAANRSLTSLDEVSVPSRIVHLPLSWDDPTVQQAVQKYLQSVRPDAPWGPDNIEFIRRINGLESCEEVRRLFFEASYCVFGLGDVYLGAPVATPVDPRHRLVTTKYNPARTWTAENSVGIGGAYLCIYGMEGPGGYQLTGRTLQVWNRYRSTDCFEPGKPWLLRFFDQIRFYEVSSEELLRMRRNFLHGRFSPKIEHTTFSLREHRAFVEKNRVTIDAFRARQQRAFAEERRRWEEAGLLEIGSDVEAPVAEPQGALPEGCVAVENVVAGSVWKLLAREGEAVAAGEPLAILESMKMEIPLESPVAGRVRNVLCGEGQAVLPGQALFALEER